MRNLYRVIHGFQNTQTGFSFYRGDFHYLDVTLADPFLQQGLLEELSELPQPDVKDSAGEVIDWPIADEAKTEAKPRPEAKQKPKTKKA